MMNEEMVAKPVEDDGYKSYGRGRVRGLNSKELKHLIKVISPNAVIANLEKDIMEAETVIGVLSKDSRIRSLILGEKRFLKNLLDKIEAAAR